MLIPKAIELLEDLRIDLLQTPREDTRDAIKLGEEALKRQKSMREHPGFSWDYYLPGETRD